MLFVFPSPHSVSPDAALSLINQPNQNLNHHISQSILPNSGPLSILGRMGKSSQIFVLTAVDVENAREEKRSDWPAIYKCTLLMLVCSVQVLMFIPSLWPFLKTIDPEVTEGFFGVVVAVFSLSQVVTSFLVGWWSNRSGSVKNQLIVCICLSSLGNLLLIVVEHLSGTWMQISVILSRILAGVGWGQVPLLKSYVSTASVDRDRTRAQAFINGGLSLGIVTGPTLQVLFSAFSFPGIRLLPGLLNLNVYTCPSLLSLLLNALMIALLVAWFRENYVDVVSRPKEQDNSTAVQLPPYDGVAVALCCLLRFTQYFVFTCLETIGSMFAMLMFSLSPLDAVFWDGVAHSLRGVTTTAVYIAYVVFDCAKGMNERVMCLLSMGGLLSFFVLTFSWPFLPHQVPLVEEGPVGCNVNEYSWCPGLTRVNVFLYYGMITLLGTAFSNINVPMSTLFSRIVGPRMQSREQGWQEMCGGIGRMLGPLLISLLYKSNGPRMVWSVEMAVVVLTMLLWLVFYKRMVPLAVSR